MAKRLTAEEARWKVIDTVNLLKNAEGADIDRYMGKYSVYRAMKESNPEEYEAEYTQISNALFGQPVEVARVTEAAGEPEILPAEVELQEEPESDPSPVILPPLGPSAPAVIPPEELGPDPVPRKPVYGFDQSRSGKLCFKREGSLEGVLDYLGLAWAMAAESWESLVGVYIALISLFEVIGEELAPKAVIAGRMAKAGALAILAGTKAAIRISIRAYRAIRSGASVARRAIIEASIHAVAWGSVLLIAGYRAGLILARTAHEAAVILASCVAEGWTMREAIINEAKVA